MLARPRPRTPAELTLWLVGAALLSGATPAAHALGTSHVKASLVSERDWIEPGKAVTVGLRLEMEDGWHTYWKNPGDAGLPPKVNWRLPEGFSAGPIFWPAPERIAAPPLMSYGYEGEVVLPMLVETPADLPVGTDVRLGGRADWVECKEVCLPGRAEVALTLPVRAEAAPTSAAGPLFERAWRAQPVGPEGWALHAASAGGKILLSFHPPGGLVVDDAYFFAAEPGKVEHPAAQVLHAGRTKHRLDVLPATNRTEPLSRLAGSFAIEILGKRLLSCPVAFADIPRASPAAMMAPVLVPPT